MFRFLKRLAITVAAIFLIWFFFGSAIYRASVKYDFIGDAKQYKVENEELKKYLDEYVDNSEDIREIAKDVQKSASKRLKFTVMYCDVDPNKLIETEETNCIGYAAYVAAGINYFIDKKQSLKGWEARPMKGQLYLFCNNMHDWFSSPFFRDHDFVIVENKQTNEKFYLDPTVYDYLGVDQVEVRK